MLLLNIHCLQLESNGEKEERLDLMLSQLVMLIDVGNRGTVFNKRLGMW